MVERNVRTWMARLAGSDLPKFKNLQPAFALMAQTTCLGLPISMQPILAREAAA
jgi:hypothetical protein